VLIEQSIAGWKEFELEVMRDTKDNVVIVCSIENFDPMGVHTGDSITVAPAQTLTDKEYQIMRDASVAIIRAIGVDTGGSNIQFASTRRRPHGRHRDEPARVAQLGAGVKATGFPIAKIAAKLAVGYTLDEIRNDITRETPACFEPTIDYVVTKIPRFTFEKFPQRPDARHADEVGGRGDGHRAHVQGVAAEGDALARDRDATASSREARPARRAAQSAARPNAAASGTSARRSAAACVDEIVALTQIDPWFLRNVEEIIAEERLAGGALATAAAAPRPSSWASPTRASRSCSARARRSPRGAPSSDVAGLQDGRHLRRRVRGHTPYLYSTYETGESEAGDASGRS
jgi:carbamoyl-phosphate synthase large subunit